MMLAELIPTLVLILILLAPLERWFGEMLLGLGFGLIWELSLAGTFIYDPGKFSAWIDGAPLGIILWWAVFFVLASWISRIYSGYFGLGKYSSVFGDLMGVCLVGIPSEIVGIYAGLWRYSQPWSAVWLKVSLGWMLIITPVLWISRRLDSWMESRLLVK